MLAALLLVLVVTIGGSSPNSFGGAVYSTPAFTRLHGGEGTPVTRYFANDGGVGMSTECSGAQVAGTAGEVMTLSRTSTTYCTKTDGTLVWVDAGVPMVQYMGASGVLGVAMDPGRTNRALRCRDFTQAVWVKSNMTAALTATDINGVANSASTLTATADNATVLQTITVASAKRATSFYLKRRAGNGEVDATRDNGTTWINVSASVGASWARVTSATYAGLNTTAANPIIGIRLVTSGDAVDVDWAQDENTASSQSWATAPILTAGSNVTRNGTVFSTPWTIGASADFSYSLDWCLYDPIGDQLVSVGLGSTDRVYMATSGTGWVGFAKGFTSSTITDAPTVGMCRHMSMIWNDTAHKCILSVSAFGGAAIGTATSAAASSGVSDATTLALGSLLGSGADFNSHTLSNVCWSTSIEGCQ